MGAYQGTFNILTLILYNYLSVQGANQIEYSNQTFTIEISTKVYVNDF